MFLQNCKTAACSSSRGILIIFKGAHLDLAATRDTSILSWAFIDLQYDTAPNASSLASTKTCSSRRPWRQLFHTSTISPGSASSHPMLGLQTSRYHKVAQKPKWVENGHNHTLLVGDLTPSITPAFTLWNFKLNLKVSSFGCQYIPSTFSVFSSLKSLEKFTGFSTEPLRATITSEELDEKLRSSSYDVAYLLRNFNGPCRPLKTWAELSTLTSLVPVTGGAILDRCGMAAEELGVELLFMAMDKARWAFNNWVWRTFIWVWRTSKLLL
ncbi:hypothetical protein FF38_09925 [Lucilia cuprina]|uniref:Uncharacterized protein n=1 Tax=Lucilia cuprina TaxID=7375 RepID=A0A0L0CPI0_LUCCU|nr:hypothetical protein FF38_09925 [Lucilia cuprina]